MFAILITAIPEADPLPMPAPPSLLWGLLLLTFFLHVLAMNFVLGGSIIAAVTRLRAQTEDSTRLLKWVARAMPTVVAAAITFGVAPLLFLQALYGRLFFTSSVLMAWWWWAVVPVVIAAYYGAYLIAFRGVRSSRALAWIGGAVAVLFLVVSFIYSNNMTLMLRPERFLPMFLENARGVQLNLSDATLVPRWLHMVLGAIAVAGLIVGVVGASKIAADRDHALWSIRFGGRWFVAATLLNVFTGIWWLGVLPREVMLAFMGGMPFATTVLAVGIFLGLVSIWMMSGASRARDPQRTVYISAALVGLTLVTMVLARDAIRQKSLEIAGFAPVTWIEPQWGVIAAFAVLLVGALATTVWMALLVVRPGPTA